MGSVCFYYTHKNLFLKRSKRNHYDDKIGNLLIDCELIRTISYAKHCVIGLQHNKYKFFYLHKNFFELYFTRRALFSYFYLKKNREIRNLYFLSRESISYLIILIFLRTQLL